MGVILEQNWAKLIQSNVVKKVKKLALSISIFHVLHGEYLLKQKVRVVQPPECKFKANHIFFSWKWQQNITQDNTSQKTIHNSVKMYKNSDKIKSSWKFMFLLFFKVSPFVISTKKIELDFECGPCWPSFCPSMILKEQFSTVLPISFQNYSIRT